VVVCVGGFDLLFSLRFGIISDRTENALKRFGDDSIRSRLLIIYLLFLVLTSYHTFYI